MQAKHLSIKSAVFYALVLYTQLLLLPPAIEGTSPSLDSSWGYQISYFFHSRFNFGADLVFSYGPLGFLTNPRNISHDVGIALIVHLLFSAAFGTQLVFIWQLGQRTAAVALCLGLALGHNLYSDYWDYSLVALALITILKIIRHQLRLFDCALLPLLIGLSFLLKFTAFSMIAAMLLIYMVHTLLNRSMVRLQGICIGLSVVAAPVAYFIYNPSLTYLFEYAKGSAQIASGFATVMATPSTDEHLHMALVVGLLLLIDLAFILFSDRSYWAECSIVLFSAWISFRHGFVRADVPHIAIFFAFACLLFSCLILIVSKTASGLKPSASRLLPVVLALSALIFLPIAIYGVSERYPVVTASNLLPTRAWNDAKTLLDLERSLNGLDHVDDVAFAALPGMPFSRQIEDKNVIVFPNANAYQVKVPFKMFPLYTLQDYAAFTAYLDDKGAKNIAKALPPVDNVILEWAAIDERNPMLDTPATTLALLSGFELQERASQALLLRHRTNPLTLQLILVNHQPFSPEVWVPIPARNHLVAMSLNLKENLIGRAQTTLLYQDSVYIEVQTVAGAVMRFRVPPLTLRNPGIINFVPASLDDWERLWKIEALPNRIVKVRLIGPGLRHTLSTGYDFYDVNDAGIRMAE